MRWLAAIVLILVFGVLTGGAFIASAMGFGLPGMLEHPVSIRQDSVGGGAHRRGSFIYFGGSRRHFGGGFSGGK